MLLWWHCIAIHGICSAYKHMLELMPAGFHQKNSTQFDAWNPQRSVYPLQAPLLLIFILLMCLRALCGCITLLCGKLKHTQASAATSKCILTVVARMQTSLNTLHFVHAHAHIYKHTHPSRCVCVGVRVCVCAKTLVNIDTEISFINVWCVPSCCCCFTWHRHSSFCIHILTHVLIYTDICVHWFIRRRALNPLPLH